MLCVGVRGCDPGRLLDGSRLALQQTLSIECPSSILLFLSFFFFWHVFCVIVPFFLSLLLFFFFHALVGAL